MVKCDTIRSKDDTGTPVLYNAVSLVSADDSAKKVPVPADTDPGTRAVRKRRKSTSKSTTPAAEIPQIPGQMDIDEVLAEMDKAPSLSDDLPFM